jgi:hypothetical protein
MSHLLVVLTNGRAEIVDISAGEDPTDYNVLHSCNSQEEAEERCAIENDPERRALLHAGKNPRFSKLA